MPSLTTSFDATKFPETSGPLSGRASSTRQSGNNTDRNNRYGGATTEVNSPISIGSGPFHEGKQYYFKFIHERNQAFFQRASLEVKSSRYVPYEAGRKIPINERVQYYMDKLTAEEEEAQRQKDE